MYYSSLPSVSPTTPITVVIIVVIADITSETVLASIVFHLDS